MMMVRVNWLKEPAPTPDTPSESSARWASGTCQRYQPKKKGSSRKDGSSHFELHWLMAAFNSGCLLPSIRAQVTIDHTPASARQTTVRKKRLGQ